VVDHRTTDETKNGMLEFPSAKRIQGSDSDWWSWATIFGVKQAIQDGAQS